MMQDVEYCMNTTVSQSHDVCVCVCVCVCARACVCVRERERGSGEHLMNGLIGRVGSLITTTDRYFQIMNIYKVKSHQNSNTVLYK
jgi:hypothetical protein